MGDVRGINTTERARLSAIAVLRNVAARLEAAPPLQAAEAAMRMADALTKLEEVAALILPE